VRWRIIFCVLIVTWMCTFSNVSVVKADGYYSYDPGKSMWIWIPWYYSYAWRPSSGKTGVTISAVGFPSDYSTKILVDNRAAGDIKGGGTVNFEMDRTESHAFQVDTYVSGGAGVRYYCAVNSWSMEKKEQQYSYSYYPYWYWWYYPYRYYAYYPTTSTQETTQSQTFIYVPEYQLTVESKHGNVGGLSKWYAKDSVVSLSVASMIQISEAARDVFKGWDLDGNLFDNPSTVVVMNGPHNAKAVYKTQYRLDVNSERGEPKGSGWYDAGTTARISIQSSIPMEGFLGALGGRYDFAGWTGADSNNPASTVSISGPTVVNARWNANYQMPIIVLVAIALIAYALAYKAGFVGLPRRPPKQSEEQAEKLDEILNRLKTSGPAKPSRQPSPEAQPEADKLDEVLKYLKNIEQRVSKLEETEN